VLHLTVDTPREMKVLLLSCIYADNPSGQVSLLLMAVPEAALQLLVAFLRYFANSVIKLGINITQVDEEAGPGSVFKRVMQAPVMIQVKGLREGAT
jgi:hypothetical protein